MSKPRKKKSLRDRMVKAAKERKARRPSFGIQSSSDPYQKALAEWRAGDPHAALDALERLHAECPGRRDVLTALTRCTHELKQFDKEVEYCQKLVKLAPESPESWYYLGTAHAENKQPALARRAFQHAVKRWPDHEYAEGGRQNIRVLEALIVDDVRHYLTEPADHQEWFALAEAHERLAIALHAGRFEKVVETATRLLARWPRFIPARNNAAEAYFGLGQLERAIEVSRETVRLVPDNLYALASLTRYLTLDGQVDEARRLAESLSGMSTDRMDHVLCAARACSLLGLNEALLDLVGRAEPSMPDVAAQNRALLYHLAAVAESNLGRRDVARRRWETALRWSPSLQIAADNLADHKKPISERHGAWPLVMGEWITPPVLERLRAVAKSTQDNETCRTRMVELFQERPSLVQLLITALRHGGPEASKFVFGIARTLDQSPLIEPLYEFATGQRGSQQLRTEILSWLGNNNLISATVHRMWLDGQWHEIKTFQNEIYDEPTTPHSPEVVDKGAEAFYLIRSNPAEAERLLREALALEPDAPDLLNNLAMALRMQGKREEAMRILHDVQQRFPDYFFGQIALAQELTDSGDHAAARDILAKLMQQPRLHISEFAAIGACYVRLAAAAGDIREAQSWLERIAEVYPDYSELPTLRKITQLAKLKQAVERRFT